MALQTLCPHCRKPYQLAESALGQPVRCPHCKQAAIVRAPSSRATEGPGVRTLAQPPAAPPPPKPPVSAPATPKPGMPPLPAVSMPKPATRKLPLALLLGAVGTLIVFAVVLGSILAFSTFTSRVPDTKPDGKIAEEKPAAEKLAKEDEAKQDVSEAKPVEKVAGKEEEVKQTSVSDDNDGPPLVLQIHSLDRMLADLKILAGEIKKSDEVAQFLKTLQAAFGEEGLPGIDSKRPWGVYVKLGAQAGFGQPVGMIPIRDEDGFLRLLHAVQCSTTKNDDGVYLAEHPQLSRKVGFRFANRHAYVAMDNFDVLNKESLVEPTKVFIAKEDADVRATFRINRIPKDLRAQALEGLRQAGPAMMAALPEASDVQRDYAKQVAKLLTDVGVDVIEGGQNLSLRLRIDAGARRFDAELQLDGVKGSSLARSLASIQDAASLLGDPSAGKLALRTRLRFRLPQELRKVLGALAHEATDKVLKDVKDPKEREEGERFLRALEPTIEAGEVDVALMLRSQGVGKPAVAVTAFRVANGLELEKVFRELVATLPEEDRRLFQFDVGKAAGANIHSMSAQRVLPPEAQQALGPNPFYYAFRRDAIVVTAGAHGQESIRQVLEGRDVTAPLVLLELNVKQLLEFIPGNEQAEQAAKVALTDMNPGRVRLVLQGGSEKLSLGFQLDLALLRLMAEMGLIQIDPRIQMKQQ